MRTDAYEGYEDGFAQVRDLLDAIVVENPGTVYELCRDPTTKVFESFVLVPAQSRAILLYSAHDVLAVDTGYTLTHHNYKAQVFVLESTDANNNTVPVAFGMYHSESEANYTHFMSTCIRTFGATVDGVVGKQLNSSQICITTDRGKACKPTFRACLPLALHRYDLWHIIKNVNDKGWNSDNTYMLACQRNTTGREFDAQMVKWRERPVAAPGSKLSFSDLPPSPSALGASMRLSVEEKICTVRRGDVAVRRESAAGTS
jgi:hypothetical protein